MQQDDAKEVVQEGEYTIVEVKTDLSQYVAAEIDSAMAFAVNHPRSLAQFKKRALALVTISQDVAESCEYGLPRGKKIVKGPSIRLAEIIVASYGNIRAGSRIISNNGRTITSQGVCHDLETNVAITIEVTRSILQHEKVWDNGKGQMVNTGRMVPMNEDMQIMAGNAASAIARRNAIFSVVPKAAWSQIAEEAKVLARGDAATLVERRTKAVEFFKSKGVTEAQIFQRLDVKGMEDIDLDKLHELSVLKTTLKNSEGSLESIFPSTDGKKKADDAANSTEKKLAQTKKTGAAGAKGTVDQMEQGLDKKPGEQ